MTPEISDNSMQPLIDAATASTTASAATSTAAGVGVVGAASPVADPAAAVVHPLASVSLDSPPDIMRHSRPALLANAANAENANTPCVLVEAAQGVSLGRTEAPHLQPIKTSIGSGPHRPSSAMPASSPVATNSATTLIHVVSPYTVDTEYSGAALTLTPKSTPTSNKESRTPTSSAQSSTISHVPLPVLPMPMTVGVFSPDTAGESMLSGTSTDSSKSVGSPLLKHFCIPSSSDQPLSTQYNSGTASPTTPSAALSVIAFSKACTMDGGIPFGAHLKIDNNLLITVSNTNKTCVYKYQLPDARVHVEWTDYSGPKPSHNASSSVLYIRAIFEQGMSKTTIILNDAQQFLSVLRVVNRRVRLMRFQTLEDIVRKLQRRWRALRVRRAYTQYRNAVIIVQSYWRMISTRRQYLLERSRLQPMQDRRESILQEITETEESYVRHLDTLVRVYLRPLRALVSEKKPALISSLSKIFCNVESILDHHHAFIAEWRSQNELPGRLFLKMASWLHIYEAYCSNYDESQRELDKCLKVPVFANFLSSASQLKESMKNDFSSLLIVPVQRVPRYELLLKDLVRHTWPTHPDRRFLCDAQRAIRACAKEINRAKMLHDNWTTVQELQRKIPACAQSKYQRKFVACEPAEYVVISSSELLPPEQSKSSFRFSVTESSSSSSSEKQNLGSASSNSNSSSTSGTTLLSSPPGARSSVISSSGASQNRGSASQRDSVLSVPPSSSSSSSTAVNVSPLSTATSSSNSTTSSPPTAAQNSSSSSNSSAANTPPQNVISSSRAVPCIVFVFTDYFVVTGKQHGLLQNRTKDNIIMCLPVDASIFEPSGSDAYTIVVRERPVSKIMSPLTTRFPQRPHRANSLSQTTSLPLKLQTSALPSTSTSAVTAATAQPPSPVQHQQQQQQKEQQPLQNEAPQQRKKLAQHCFRFRAKETRGKLLEDLAECHRIVLGSLHSMHAHTAEAAQARLSESRLADTRENTAPDVNQNSDGRASSETCIRKNTQGSTESVALNNRHRVSSTSLTSDSHVRTTSASSRISLVGSRSTSRASDPNVAADAKKALDTIAQNRDKTPSRSSSLRSLK